MNKWQSIYRMAHVATGSSELAEVVLQEALLNAYVRMDDGTLRENMRRAVSEAALAQLKQAKRAGHLELDWDGFTHRPESLSEQDAPIWDFMAEQSVQTRRIVMLRYALRWSPRQVADVMDMHTGEVKELYQRVTAQLQRRGGPSTVVARNMRISPFDRAMARVVRLELNRTGDDLPDVAAVMQAFEQDASAVHRPNVTARKLTGGVLRMLIALLVALVFYLGAIMAQDPYDQSIHVEQVNDPDATAAPVLTLPALGGYEMVDAGRQMEVSDLSELNYYFSLPVARLQAEGWGLSAAYIRDERGIGGTTTRAAVLDYTDAQGRMLRVRSMLPGDEACARRGSDGLHRQRCAHSRLGGGAVALRRLEQDIHADRSGGLLPGRRAASGRVDRAGGQRGHSVTHPLATALPARMFGNVQCVLMQTRFRRMAVESGF